MAVNVDIEELITLNYEIEGLLYLALHRGTDTPESVWRLIKEKVCSLNESISFNDEEDASGVDSEAGLLEDSGERHSENVEECGDLSEESSIEMEVEAAEESCDTSEESSIEMEAEAAEESCDTPEESPLEVEAEVTDESCDVAEAPLLEDEADADEIDAIELPTIEELLQTHDELPSQDLSEGVDSSSEVDYTESADNVEPENASDEASGDIDFVDDEDDVPVESPSVRLDEKLARNNSKNLRKAFSLNDKFRFRRELFSNSDTEMTDTLNLIEAMSSYSEAEEYFFTDMQWDPKLPEVEDFMLIIKNHFS